MSYKPKQTVRHVFDQAELDRRIENEIAFYATRTTDHKAPGALVKISHSNVTWFLAEVAEKVLAGYTHRIESPVLTTYPEYSAFYTKPLAMQEEDKKLIADKVEQAYRAELQAAYEHHLEAIIAETLAREEKAEQKKIEVAKAKRLAAARAEAIAALGKFPQ